MMHSMTQTFKNPTYENVFIGETFGPVALTLDEYFLRSYAYALDDYTGMTLVDGMLKPVGHVPPHMIVSDLMQIFLTVYDRDKVVGLHQKEEVEHYKPVPVGATLTLTGTYVDKYFKRGKGYTVLESIARDESGDVVILQRSTEVMRAPDGVQVGTGSGNPERRISPRSIRGERVRTVTPSMPVGTGLAPLVKQVRQAQMSVFTGAEFHKQGIHTVRSIALKARLKDCIAQGMMESCWASEYLFRLFGESFLSTGKHFTTYLSPVYPKDIITIEGEIVGSVSENGKVRVEVEYWLLNQDGVTTAVGYGSSLL
jgi:acyl dehydratase